jgi:hypothetical protein
METKTKDMAIGSGVSKGAPEKGASSLRLMELHISNFRGIEALDLSFTGENGETQDKAVLSGDNGTGKTAALEAVLLLLGQRALLSPDLPPLREQVRFGADAFVISGDVEMCRGPHSLMEIVHLEVNSTQLDRPTPPGQTSGASYGDLLRRLSPRVEYFSARRRVALREGEGQGGQSPEAQRVLNLRQRLLQLAARRRLLAAGKQAPMPGPDRDEAALEKLQTMWRRFHGPGQRIDFLPTDNRPDAPLEVVVREDRPLPKDATSLLLARRMAPLRRDVPWMVPLLQLGSGDLALLSFAGALLFGDARPDLLVIDEPEQQIQRGWHALLVETLRHLAPGAQLLMATHSDEIMGTAQGFQGFMLLRPELEEVVPPSHGPGGPRRVMVSRPPALP